MTPIMVKLLLGLSMLLATLDGLSAQRETLNPQGCGVSHYKTMIVNGTEVEEAQYPWMVCLYTQFPSGNFGCGGTIITKRHVLTAAHCLLNEHGEYVLKVIVSYGSVDRRRGKFVEASKMLIHKGYDLKTHVNDIALLQVKYPFPFGKDVTPICLQMAPVPLVNKDAVAAGWGSSIYNGSAVEVLRHTAVTIYPDHLCASIYGKDKYSPALQCCSLKRGKGVCSGDSGGPLMIRTGVDRFQQVGIASYVGDICGGDDPDVYTRVSGYADWLTRGVSSSAGYKPLNNPFAYMLESGPFLIA